MKKITFIISLLFLIIGSVFAADNCGYKSDGKYHCGTNCGYKADGKYHCGTNCGYKSDGKFHCEGEG